MQRDSWELSFFGFDKRNKSPQLWASPSRDRSPLSLSSSRCVPIVWVSPAFELLRPKCALGVSKTQAEVWFLCKRKGELFHPTERSRCSDRNEHRQHFTCSHLFIPLFLWSVHLTIFFQHFPFLLPPHPFFPLCLTLSCGGEQGSAGQGEIGVMNLGHSCLLRRASLGCS